jgi:hypothetical protein
MCERARYEKRDHLSFGLTMHSFTELIDRCATFTLKTLKEANDRTIEALQTSGATSLVKTLQMIQLQKAILAVGMFSIFEASLQRGLSCSDGFGEAKNILDDEEELDMKEYFDDLFQAVNVLKHGRGRSYEALVVRAESLPFRIKLPDESFFFEGDISEVSTLIEVDDAFVQRCGDVIRDVSEVIRRVRPEFA